MGPCPKLLYLMAILKKGSLSIWAARLTRYNHLVANYPFLATCARLHPVRSGGACH